MANELRVRTSPLCHVCGVEFIPTGNRQLYCSVSCQKARKAARAAEQYAANPEAYKASHNAYYAANSAKVVDRVRKYRQRNPEKTKAARRREGLRRRYGMTVEDYARLLAAQDGVCAVCKKVESVVLSLPVDHDHKTGKVRALLCTPCNTTLGLTGEDPDRLRALADYLEFHRE